MSDILADTHAVVWMLFEPVNLSAAALQAFQSAQAGGGRALVSAITPIEVTYLVEKGKLPAPYLAGLWAAISDPNTPVDVLPVSIDVARGLDQIPRGIVPDMPDRIIAATALVHNLSLVTADTKIRSAPIQTIW